MMSSENNEMKQSNEMSQRLENENSNNEDSITTEEAFEYAPFSEEIDGDGDGDSAPSSQQKETSNPSEEQVRIQLLEEQLNRTKDQMIRALADAENSRKRAQKDREEASKFAVSSFARDLLSVADNLRRALEAMPVNLLEEHPPIKNLTDGIEATERELIRCFEKNGIIKLEPLDERFDPNFHEVMFEAPMPDKESGTIIQVMEPGYMINGRILRPARVGIAKGDNGSPPPPEGGHTIDTEV